MRIGITQLVALVLVGLILTNALIAEPVNAISIPVLVAVLMSGIIGLVIGYSWGRAVAEAGAPEQTVNEIVNQLYLLDYYLIDTINNTLYLTNNFLPRTANYYIRWAEAGASVECADKIKKFEESEVGKAINLEISSLFNNVTTQILKTSASYFALYKIHGQRAWLLRNKQDTTLCTQYTCVWVQPTGDTYISLYQPLAPAYIKVGSPCKLVVTIHYTDRSVEDVPIGWFIMGESDHRLDPDGINVVYDLVNMRRNGKTISHFWVGGDCDVDYNPYGVNWLITDMISIKYGEFIDWLASLYRETRNAYNLHCQLTNMYPGQPIVPPSVVLPFNLKDLEKIPPELRLQLYMAYLQALLNTDWRNATSLEPGNVTIVYPGMIISQGKKYMPLVLPYSFKIVRGKPVPLVGTWFVDGKIIVYPAYEVQYGHIYEVVEGNLYWVRDYYDNILGVAIDVDKDGTPDVWTPNYIIVEELYVWDPENHTWKPADTLEIGPEPVTNWVAKTNVDEYLKKMEKELEDIKSRLNQLLDWLNKISDWFKNVKQNFDKYKWVLIGVGAFLLLLIIIAVSRGGGGKTVVVSR
ncbi:MAG: hypothetical protein QW607_01935 [Desulfurococcaceae archaeon]